jgi:20S proteasome alpha/beta subunit
MDNLLLRYLNQYYCFAFRTVVGLKCKDGVVLGMEKILHSKLLKRNTNRRIMNVDLHVGLVICWFCSFISI